MGHTSRQGSMFNSLPRQLLACKTTWKRRIQAKYPIENNYGDNCNVWHLHIRVLVSCYYFRRAHCLTAMLVYMRYLEALPKITHKKSSVATWCTNQKYN